MVWYGMVRASEKVGCPRIKEGVRCEGGMMRETVGGSEGQRKGHRPCNIRRTLP